jgi:hypothetical protein
MECHVSDTLEQELNCSEIINSCPLQHLSDYLDLVFKKLGIVRAQSLGHVEHHLGEVLL